VTHKPSTHQMCRPNTWNRDEKITFAVLIIASEERETKSPRQSESRTNLTSPFPERGALVSSGASHDHICLM
jgi:hypothetical protein